MIKINFKEFKVKESFGSDRFKTEDLREAFADLIYKKTEGMRCFKLAEKIYQSEGEVEIDDTEENILDEIVTQLCTPQIIDSYTILKEGQSK